MRRKVDSKSRLRLLLGALLVGLAVPAWLLIRQASSQLDLEAFRRQQLIAEETVRRIDMTLGAAIAAEESRPFDDYAFATTPRNAAGNVVQRSPLSQWPRPASLPGTIGYFQVDAGGTLTTPLLPASGDAAEFGIGDVERDERVAAEMRILDVLSRNRLVRDRPSSPAPAAFAQANRGQAAFDALVGDLALEERVVRAEPDAAEQAQQAPRVPQVPRVPQRAGREAAAAVAGDVDATAAPASADAADAAAKTESEAAERQDAAADGLAADGLAAGGLESGARISTFESDLEPLQLSRLDTGHLVLFRNAWRDGARFIQGMLIDQREFLVSAIATDFTAGGHADGTRLFAALGGGAAVELTPSAATSGAGRTVRPLYAARLSPPLAQIELSFLAAELPAGPAERVLTWAAVVLAGVLLLGTYAIYRFGVRQIELTRQHQDFVSAVSHELKTPLTSIRMYGEMLKSGWASDEKKQTYYDYIFAEGERLSRLIDNVLQIARLNRGSVPVKLEIVSVGELLDVLQSKVATTVERAGFELTIEAESPIRAAQMRIDRDACVQIFINLVDNAAKFARDAERREIVISADSLEPDRILLCVRDFGEGISPRDMQHLFDLFYRSSNERTRTTAGTGIGLALVHQLVAAMHGSVDVRNRHPGAEFRLVFPRAGAGRAHS